MGRSSENAAKLYGAKDVPVEERNWRVQCAATVKNDPDNPDRQCKKWAMVGSTVCRSHGGAVKTARNKAGERVDEIVAAAKTRVQKAAEKAAVTLEDALISTDEQVRLRAALAILDRNGVADLAQSEGGSREDETINERIDTLLERKGDELAAKRAEKEAS